LEAAGALAGAGITTVLLFSITVVFPPKTPFVQATKLHLPSGESRREYQQAGGTDESLSTIGVINF
jgi:hypothetical protein